MKTPEQLALERGRRFTQLREDAKMSKREFARTVGISPAYVVYLENGVRSDGTIFNPTDHMLQMICHKFGCSYQWLKSGVGKQNSTLRQKLLAQLMNLPDEMLPKVKTFIDTLTKREVELMVLVGTASSGWLIGHWLVLHAA